MENCKTSQKIAYIRALQATNQCELTFHFKDTIHGTALNEEIKAVRQITDTVASLLLHTQNKLIKLSKVKSVNAEGETEEVVTKVPMRLEENNVQIDDEVVLKDIIETGKVDTFYVLQQRFSVEVNAPLVQLAVLPTVFYAKAIVQPIKFRYLYTSRTISIYEWYKSLDKKNWEKVGDKFTYKIKASDINYYIKFRCVPKSVHCSGPPYEVISESTVKALPGLPKCPFEERHKQTPKKLTGKE